MFDGARYFEGVTPDLDRHMARVNTSALAMGLEPTHTGPEIVKIVRDGLKRFKSNEAVYIRPMYWSETGGYMYIPPDPATTRFLVYLVEEPMIPRQGLLGHLRQSGGGRPPKWRRRTPRPAASIQ